MVSARPLPGRRQRRLGQNFLADTNLLDLIVRESELSASDVVLEVGGGAGVLTERLALAGVRCVHLVELDPGLRPGLEELAEKHPVVRPVFADAMDLDVGSLDPAPTKLVSNMPYSIAAPFLLRTITDAPAIGFWLAMVQLEIGERLRASPGNAAYGSPSVAAQLACDVELIRKVDPAVFVPRPRVGSALIRMRRVREAPGPGLSQLVRDGFAHRRKALPRSLEHAHPGRLALAREALVAMGLPADARAEALSPEQFRELGARLGVEG